MTPIAEESLAFHAQKRGKIEVISTVKVNDAHDLSVAYTPGVAQPCLEIQKDVDQSYELTRRWNMAAVITDGTAVLGLGDIGPEAGMPVMEGKCVLFKEFGGVDAFPLCIKSKDVDEIVRTVYLISGSFGAINLEDISAPRCFEIEARLKELCDIPVFHDDQHGTAVIALAGMTNALKVVGKKREEVKVVINGAGAAGMLLAFFSVGGLAHGLMTGELTGALATPLSWVPLAWPARLGSLGVEAFIDAARAAGPLLTTALAGLVLALTADAVLLAWFCRFEDGRADA